MKKLLSFIPVTIMIVSGCCFNSTPPKTEYFTIANEKTLKSTKNKKTNKKYRAFIAVFAGEIRLIDNIKLKN